MNKKERINMKYEYKVTKASVNAAEKEMNKLAKDGWRVITISPNVAVGMGVVITLEREIED